MRKIISLLLIGMLLVLLSACSANKYSINEPDQVIFYKNGVTQQYDNNGSDTFSEMWIRMDQRFSKELKLLDDKVGSSEVNNLQNATLAVEFIYNKTQQLKLKADGNKTISYKRLFFPLVINKENNDQNSETYKFLYSENDAYTNSPIGTLGNPERVTKWIMDSYFPNPQ